MKKIRLKQAENSVASSQPPEVSPEADKQNREIAVNLLASVVEKIQNLPPVPVKESYSELLDQMRFGVKREPVIIDRYDGRKILINESGETIDVTDEKPLEVPRGDTLYDTGGEENSGGRGGNFTESELQILKQYDG